MTQPRRRRCRYPVPPATMTDLYELTMAAGYWKLGRLDDEAIFTLIFRQAPFGGGFTIAAGLEGVVAFIERFRFSPDELAHLAGLRGTDDRPLFERRVPRLPRGAAADASTWTRCPRARVVFPHEPLVRVTGSLLEAQLLETRAAQPRELPHARRDEGRPRRRSRRAARRCIEFGLRRAQGPDGGLTASRAAYLGGCYATSNVLAGRLFGIPVRGTHAHSWVLSFADEQAAFDAWAEVMPGNAVLLVDTYDTVDGIANAIETGRRMRERGQQLAGIRLDSGDLAYLSIRAREMLDAAGFEDARSSPRTTSTPRRSSRSRRRARGSTPGASAPSS